MARLIKPIFTIAILLTAGFYSYQTAYGWRILAQTNELFAVGTVGSEHSYLYRIDPATGETTLIGDTGLNNCTGLDFTPDDKLKAFCEFREDAEVVSKGLLEAGAAVELNIDDGAGEWAVPHGISNNISDITIREDGVLFSYEKIDIDNLHQHQKEDDFMAMLIGNPNIDSQHIGLAAWGDSELKAFANVDDESWMFKLDSETGAATPLGTLSFPDSLGDQLSQDISTRAEPDLIQFASVDRARIAGVDIPTSNTTSAAVIGYAFREQDADFAALLFKSDGVVMKASPTNSQNGILVGDWAAIALIDADTRQIDYIVELQNPGFAIQAIALRPRSLAQVPTLSEWGLITTAILLFAGGLVFFIRRKPRVLV
ncbi:MAG: hypothetical protein DHS20C13_01920 [Thermodesulfobacteriota bacterium]|nr:MAG: hypothetical protein DHS20C13_01920 [Thermodesulfobacteriota bacterium]